MSETTLPGPEQTTELFWEKVTQLYQTIDPIISEIHGQPESLLSTPPTIRYSYYLAEAMRNAVQFSHTEGSQALDTAVQSVEFFYNDKEAGVSIQDYDPMVIRKMLGHELLQFVPIIYNRDIKQLLAGRTIHAESQTDTGFDVRINQTMAQLPIKPDAITEPFLRVDVSIGELWLGSEDWCYQVPFVDPFDHSLRVSEITVAE